MDNMLQIWNLTRASGLVAYFLLALCVCTGLLAQILKQHQKPVWIWPLLHQSLGLWSLYLSIFHTCIMLFDRYVGLRWYEIFVPFLSEYHMVPLALGIMGLYGLLFVIIATDFRSRLGAALWRRTHMLSPLAFVMATFHGIYMGTDTTGLLPQVLYTASASLTGILTIIRLGAKEKISVSSQ